MSLDPHAAAREVKEAARAAGFDLVGIAEATPLDPRPLDHWLERGWDAGLWYVRESREARLDPSRVCPGARSVVVVAAAYGHADPSRPATPHGEVSRYARGRDYHNVLRRPLARLRGRIDALVPGSRAYAACDTRPVAEKAWAERAGIGWVGKNGCLIAPPFGSWVLLGAVVTTAELAPDAPHPERCGSCTACLGACPTGALPQPGFVDAGRCISFHTIEHRDPIPPEIAERLGGRLFGCDACQEPCPWNRQASAGEGPLSAAFSPQPGRAFVPLASLLSGSDAALEEFARATPLARAGAVGLRRTAQALAGSGSAPRSEPPSADAGERGDCK